MHNLHFPSPSSHLYSNLESFDSLVVVPGSDETLVQVVDFLHILLLSEVECLFDGALLQVIQLLQSMFNLVASCSLGLCLHCNKGVNLKIMGKVLFGS